MLLTQTCPLSRLFHVLINLFKKKMFLNVCIYSLFAALTVYSLFFPPHSSSQTSMWHLDQIYFISSPLKRLCGILIKSTLFLLSSIVVSSLRHSYIILSKPYNNCKSVVFSPKALQIVILLLCF